MDTTTAVLMAITNLDPTVLVDIQTIRGDVEQIEGRQGTMTEADIMQYARNYVASAPNQDVLF